MGIFKVNGDIDAPNVLKAPETTASAGQVLVATADGGTEWASVAAGSGGSTLLTASPGESVLAVDNVTNKAISIDIVDSCPAYYSTDNVTFTRVPAEGVFFESYTGSIWIGGPAAVGAPGTRKALPIDNLLLMSVDERKAELREMAASRRWKAENAVVEVAGNTYATDIYSQPKIDQVLGLMTAGTITTVSWKTNNGFVPLNQAELKAVRDAIVTRVQALFANEEAIQTAINAATDHNDLDLIGINSGWE